MKLWQITICIMLVIPLSGRAALLRDLKVGDRGEDVRELQQKLNTNLATRVSFTGLGSPGNETDYFGPATEAAVKRYQTAHAATVLAPANLNTATGYVGPLTRASLNTETSATYRTESVSTSYNQTSVAHQDEVLSEDVRFGMFLNKLRELNVNNPDIDNFDLVEEEIKTLVAERNLEEVFNEENATRRQGRTIDEILEDVERNDLQVSLPLRDHIYALLKDLVPGPSIAHAQALIPFGGPIYYAFFCTCSFTWLLFIGQPSFVLLDYETGTQAFLNYNIPYTTNTLGQYLPLGVSACYIYYGFGCTSLISNGFLTPIVGSGSF